MFLMTSALLGYVSGGFCGDVIYVMNFLFLPLSVVYVCFSRYIHLAWIRLHQGGFILRMDCFYFCIRFDSYPHGWCCQYCFFNGVPGCRQGLMCLWHVFFFLFSLSFDRLLMLLMENKLGGQTRPVHWGSFLTMVIYVVEFICQPLLLLTVAEMCFWCFQCIAGCDALACAVCVFPSLVF